MQNHIEQIDSIKLALLSEIRDALKTRNLTAVAKEIDISRTTLSNIRANNKKFELSDRLLKRLHTYLKIGK